MPKKTVAVLVLVAFLITTIGCHHTVKRPPEKLEGGSEKIIKIALVDGRVIEFDADGGRYSSETRQISGYTPVAALATYQGRDTVISSFEPVNMPVDSVLQVWVRKSDPALTVLAVLTVTVLVALVAALVAAAFKESCPFVYAWDGQKYVFDAEPLGGAICEGLQRSECSRLEYAAPDAGRYRVKFRNEVPETQYLDQVGLLVVDHAPDQLIVPDAACRLHVISNARSPLGATDESGADIRTFVAERDGLAWQTHMTESALKRTADTRHHLAFEFAKPVGAKHARLIVNAGTAIWGSNMIREMLQMRGSQVDQWYREVNRRGAKALELLSFNLREEMYLLKLYVQGDDSLLERALIPGGGPFLAEDRVIGFDVSDIPGDRLTLRLNPPKGFWMIDYLAVEYDDSTMAAPRAVPVGSAQDQSGRDITAELAAIDSVRYVMPRVGDWADISFAAPPGAPDLARSVFLVTTGYYEIQIDKKAPEQTALIHRMLSEPGAIITYAIDKYVEWTQQQARDN